MHPTASKALMATTNTVPVVTKGPMEDRLFAEEAHPTASKPPRATTNTAPGVTKGRLDNRLSAEDRRGIFELVRTVYTNSPDSSALTLVAGPEENTVRVWRTANKIAHGVATETITLTKEKGRWKIQSISR